MTTRTKAKPTATASASPANTSAADLSASSAPRPESKIGQVIALLERKQGATLAEMTGATGWQPHSARAVLTGLRKKGHIIAKSKRDGVTCYRITGAAMDLYRFCAGHLRV